MVTLWLQNAYRKWKNRELYEYIKAQAVREYEEDKKRKIKLGQYKSPRLFEGWSKHADTQYKTGKSYSSKLLIDEALIAIQQQKLEKKTQGIVHQTQTPTQKQVLINHKLKQAQAKEIEQVLKQDLADTKKEEPLTFEQQVGKHYKLDIFLADVKETVSLYKTQPTDQRTAMELSYQQQLNDSSISEGQKIYFKTILEEIYRVKAERAISQSLNQKKKKHKKRKR